jgi:hypothetical protein
LQEKSGTDPILCDAVLDRLGFYLSLFSLICLGIMTLIFATRWIPLLKDFTLIKLINNSRRKDTFILICYVVCMLLFYFLFLVFIDQKVTGSAVFCKLTAALLYCLFLRLVCVFDFFLDFREISRIDISWLLCEKFKNLDLSVEFYVLKISVLDQNDWIFCH